MKYNVNGKIIDIETDWRIMGQEGYLMNDTLEYRKYLKSMCFEDFTQCEFCWDTFEEGEKVYWSPKERVWVCKECYNDFKEHFKWEVNIIND